MTSRRSQSMALLSCAVLSGFLAACNTSAGESKGPEGGGGGGKGGRGGRGGSGAVVQIEVTTPQRISVQREVDLSGTLTSPDQARVSSEVAGRIQDVVVQIGPVPVEGTAVLATEARERLAAVDRVIVDAASRALDDPGISIVDAALFATELGATAMHDPTEGGLAAGLRELAVASGCSVHIDRSRVRWFEPGRVVCEALGADPWATLASGCLLATFPHDVADVAVARLTAHGLDLSVLGRVDAGRGVYDETGSEVVWPERDEVARILERWSN